MMAHPAPPSSANRGPNVPTDPGLEPCRPVGLVGRTRPPSPGQPPDLRGRPGAPQRPRIGNASQGPQGRPDLPAPGPAALRAVPAPPAGQWVHQQAYYRCRYPAEYATAAGFDHPRSVYLREGDLLPVIDGWLARLTDPDHLQATCEAIAGTSHARTALDRDRAAARQVVADCDRRLGRYRAALEAGATPARRPLDRGGDGAKASRRGRPPQPGRSTSSRQSRAGPPCDPGARWPPHCAGRQRPGAARAAVPGTRHRGPTTRTAASSWFGRISVGLSNVSEGDLNPRALFGH
jgi:hypothetical protein